MANDESKDAKAGIELPNDTFNDLVAARRGGLFSRLSGRFNDALQESRGGAQRQTPVEEIRRTPVLASPDDSGARRPKNANFRRMLIPEGVTIHGALTGGAESEIGGRIEGDVNVNGPLLLHKNGVITGTIRATSCQIDGLVEGRVEVTDDLTIGKTGRVSSDASAGRNIDVSGQVHGAMSTPGRLRLLAGGIVNGDVHVRVLYMEEGAALNGTCAMRAPAPKTENAPS